jgi:lysophospholipase L1-like esterase
VKWLIVSIGVNDIGNTRNEEASQRAAKEVIAGYEEFISKAHEKGIKVYGATIIPFGKSQYDGDSRQKARQAINEWIRTSGKFDAVIDFDQAMRDPSAPNNMRNELQSGDNLHPSEAGYKTMGDCIDLTLFE